jgi:hypothetical protein
MVKNGKAKTVMFTPGKSQDDKLVAALGMCESVYKIQ